jgi:hypothetical protein
MGLFVVPYYMGLRPLIHHFYKRRGAILPRMDPEVQKELAHVEGILDEIRVNTAIPWWRSVLNGLLYGAGWTVGTIGAFAALGWLLSIFGIIPGFDVIGTWIQNAMSHKF